MSGFGAEAPTDNARKKARRCRAFLYCRKKLELRSKLCFKRLFEKSPLKIRKNFPPSTSLYFVEAFEVPRNFSRKVSCVRVWGGQPRHLILMQKARQNRAFLYCRKKLELRSKLCFKRLFEKSPLKIRKNFAPNTSLYFVEAFEVPRNFSRKVSCVRVWGGSPDI